MLVYEDLTGTIISCAIRVHKTLGPGLLESVYEACLSHELVKENLKVQRQLEVPIVYDEIKIDAGFRLDLLVDDKVIVELKAIEKTLNIHEAQLMTYLRLSGKRVGLLINFNTLRLRDGILRRVI